LGQATSTALILLQHVLQSIANTMTWGVVKAAGLMGGSFPNLPQSAGVLSPSPAHFPLSFIFFSPSFFPVISLHSKISFYLPSKTLKQKDNYRRVRAVLEDGELSHWSLLGFVQ